MSRLQERLEKRQADSSANYKHTWATVSCLALSGLRAALEKAFTEAPCYASGTTLGKMYCDKKQPLSLQLYGLSSCVRIL